MLCHVSTVRRANAAMAERSPVSLAESAGWNSLIISASIATSSTSTDLTTFGLGSTQTSDMVLSWCAGLFALLVAFAPTAPAPPATEPQWVNYLHHAAAGALIFTLGVFCLVLERGDTAGAANLDPAEPAGYSTQPQVPSWRKILYFTCGGLVLLSGALALYTGIWPTSWSTGWSSLYLFEAVAVFASLQPPRTLLRLRDQSPRTPPAHRQISQEGDARPATVDMPEPSSGHESKPVRVMRVSSRAS